MSLDKVSTNNLKIELIKREIEFFYPIRDKIEIDKSNTLFITPYGKNDTIRGYIIDVVNKYFPNIELKMFYGNDVTMFEFDINTARTLI